MSATVPPRRDCDSEPIHLPGLVQPYGCLLVVDDDGIVRQVSANCADVLGGAPEQILGVPIGRWLTALSCDGGLAVAWGLRKPERAASTVDTGSVRSGFLPDAILDVSMHTNSQGWWIIECERRTEPWQARLRAVERLMRRTARALEVLYQAKTTLRLARRAAVGVSRCFAFDRVMVYQFDAQWNGTVIAEVRRGEVDSYLSLKFPASDIPSQARLTFLHNGVRTIPNVNFAPQPMLQREHAAVAMDGAAPRAPEGQRAMRVDMLTCHLRAPSTVHIEYLRNMGVGATMTLTLSTEGRLWGLIACHHLTPKVIGFEQRQAAQMLARCTSSLLSSREYSGSVAKRNRVKKVLHRLRANMAGADDLVAGLIRRHPTILDLIEGEQTSAAVYFEGRWRFAGRVPPLSALDALVQWLGAQQGKDDVWWTDCLTAVYPPAAEYTDVASGLLALSIPKNDNSWVLWFRPEVPRNIAWAGNPTKNIVTTAAGTSLHPRHSFAAWQQIVQNHAVSFCAVDIEAAQTLRKSIIERDLQRQVRREQRSRAEAEMQRQRFLFLSEATGLLSASLDYRDNLDKFAELVTRWFCDWMCIYLDDGAGTLTRQVLRHRTAQGQLVLAQLRQFAPIWQLVGGWADAAPDPSARLFVPRTRIWLERKVDGGHDTDLEAYLQFLRDNVGFASFVLMPIVARGKVLGSIKFVREDAARRFTLDDYRLAHQLGQRAASCIDSALLYQGAEAAIGARDHVLNVVSHDLRNPLGAIKLTADLMARRLRCGDGVLHADAVADGLAKMQLACRRMDGLIEDVLSLSKMEAGKYRLECRPTQVSAILADALALLEPLAAAKGVALRATHGAPGVRVDCDYERITQVFSNLVGNAIKFTPPQGTIEVAARRDPDGRGLLFSVTDSGCGIDAADLPHIFDRFWQATRTARHGSGLGLAIAKGIVEAHSGQIWVRSSPGEGTTFYFTLRLVESA